ncbi:MAG: hypothetical protein ACI9HK_006020 [Pirellulaceae bacterium]|jgi:hypothetical protein
MSKLPPHSVTTPLSYHPTQFALGLAIYRLPQSELKRGGRGRFLRNWAAGGGFEEQC